MSRKKRKSRTRTRAPESVKPNKIKRVLNIALSVILITALGLVAYLVFFSNDKSITVVTPGAFTNTLTHTPKVTRKAKSLDELLAMPAEQLANVDIAEMNLLCATGLPGAENLNIDHALATLDQWAARVKSETNRHLYRVTDPRYADHYRHSEALLRAEMLLQVLQVDLGVKYDMTAAHNFAFNDSRVAFIHGMIPTPGQTTADTPGGTCASMPVMYVAVGRRLGYPLKLVITKGHIFARWDGKNHPNPTWRERFNIEGSGDGFSSFEDDYYKTWPFKVTDREVRVNRYLISLTPTEEFAEFLAARGHCGRDNGKLAFAARCFEKAYRYDTSRPCYRNWFIEVAMRSGYRPATPALARLLARRIDPITAAERIVAQQQLAARREWLRKQASGMQTPGLPKGIPAGGPYSPHPGVHQPQVPHLPHYPGYQPYRPPVPSQPRR